MMEYAFPQIERMLGRALTDDETIVRSGFDGMNEQQRELARWLTKRQLVLAAMYIRYITRENLRDVIEYMDDINSGR